jgi:SAM-dependent methyltransferase
LGELIDRWLLDRPMMKALRAFREPVLELVANGLPRHRNRRVLVVNAGTGTLVASLVHRVDHVPTVVSVLDQSRESLAYLDAGPVMRPRSVELKTIQENIVAFAIGRAKVAVAPQDTIVLHGLLEYMPERVAVSMLVQCRHLLAPGGSIVACMIGPSDDQDLLDWMLGWPTVRRSREAARRLFVAAGLDASEIEMHPPALVTVGKAPTAAAVREDAATEETATPAVPAKGGGDAPSLDDPPR